MNLLYDVSTELGQFAVQSVRELFRPTPAKTLIAPPVSKALPARNQVLVEALPDGDEVEDGPSTFRSLKSVVAARIPDAVVVPETTASTTNTPTHTITGQPVVMAEDSVLLFQHPTKEFDAVQAVLPYGAEARLMREQGAWAEVSHGGKTGWVERDQLVSSQAQVRPYFVIKEYCGATAETTKRLRRMIGDEFYGGRAELPLQAEEYVYYKLFIRGVFIPNVTERPRQAGRWQKLFAGQRGVHISVRPKTGSVVEYVTEADEGRLAYVEAVFPDESVSLSEVGEPETGFYSERTLGKEVWQALSPVFIQFS